MSTTTTKTAAIYKALFARLAAFSVSPALPVQYPEPTTTFTPPNSGKYLIADVFPNRPRWVGMSGDKVSQGFLLVTVVWPKNQGLIAPGEVAGLIQAHFDAARDLYADGYRVRIDAGSYDAGAIIEPDSVRIPVTIPWSA